MGTALPDGPAIWVGTNLELLHSEPPHAFATDVVISGVCYRRLDPAYYAWLRNRVAEMRRSGDAGRLPTQTFEAVRERFHAVHTWAVKAFGNSVLQDAARQFNPRTYEPPRIDEDGLPGVLAPLDPSPPGDTNTRQAALARIT